MRCRERLCRNYGRHGVLGSGSYRVVWLPSLWKRWSGGELIHACDTRIGSWGSWEDTRLQGSGGSRQGCAAMCVRRCGKMKERRLSSAASVKVFSCSASVSAAKEITLIGISSVMRNGWPYLKSTLGTLLSPAKARERRRLTFVA